MLSDYTAHQCVLHVYKETSRQLFILYCLLKSHSNNVGTSVNLTCYSSAYLTIITQKRTASGTTNSQYINSPDIGDFVYILGIFQDSPVCSETFLFQTPEMRILLYFTTSQNIAWTFWKSKDAQNRRVPLYIPSTVLDHPSCSHFRVTSG